MMCYDNSFILSKINDFKSDYFIDQCSQVLWELCTQLFVVVFCLVLSNFVILIFCSAVFVFIAFVLELSNFMFVSSKGVTNLG